MTVKTVTERRASPAGHRQWGDDRLLAPTRRPLATAVAAGVRLDLDGRLGGAAPDRLTGLTAAYLLLPLLIFLGRWQRSGSPRRR